MSQQETESWIDRALQIGLVALISWNLYTTQDLGKEVAVIQAILSQPSTDVALLSQRVSRLEQWNANLSERVSSIEKDLRLESK